MMRILLLGKYGQLGWELRRSLAPIGEVIALDSPEIDLVHADAVRNAIRGCSPDVLINATAYTAVDRAESEAELARAVNGRAPRIMSEEAAARGIPLIHYSTDYVFDGTKGSPYLEEDTPNPLGVYGQSKLEGERAVIASGAVHLIFRTSWLYSLRKDSFVTKVLQWSRQQAVLRVVSDQVGNPTWARMLAKTTALLLARAGNQAAAWLKERQGVYHLAGNGQASRLEWAEAILRYDPRPEEQATRRIEAALTAEFPTPALRPLYSALDCRRFVDTFGLSLPNWRETLQLAMESL
jgi:dTDP-4-dehydrorhamnose reductase